MLSLKEKTSNLVNYAKIGIGFETMKESITGALESIAYTHASSLTEMYYALSDKKIPDLFSKLDTLTDSYCWGCDAKDQVVITVLGVGGAILLTSGIHNLVKNYRTERNST